MLREHIAGLNKRAAETDLRLSGEVHIIGSKGDLLRILAAASGVKSRLAAFAVLY